MLLDLTLHGTPGQLAVLFASGSPAPSTIPGAPELWLGNGFTELVLVTVFPADGISGAVSFPVALDGAFPEPPCVLDLYFQGISVDPNGQLDSIQRSNREEWHDYMLF